jgi:hypothetical protein
MHLARRSELTGLVCNRLDTHATPGSVKLPKRGSRVGCCCSPDFLVSVSISIKVNCKNIKKFAFHITPGRQNKNPTATFDFFPSTLTWLIKHYDDRVHITPRVKNHEYRLDFKEMRTEIAAERCTRDYSLFALETICARSGGGVCACARWH